MSAALGITLGIISAAAYFAPTITAFIRGMGNRWSVLVVDLLLGWSVIGWIVALTMAVKNARPALPPQAYEQELDRWRRRGYRQ